MKERSRWSRCAHYILLVCASVGLAFFYAWFYTSVLGLDLPKTALLKKRNAEWLARIDVMNRHLDECEEILSGLEVRDNDIYRAVFGLEEIPQEIRNAGFGGVNRYSHFSTVYNGSLLRETMTRLDVLTKKTYIQSTSFDEIHTESQRAGNLISCIPAILPMVPYEGYRISSSFGTRSDPFTGRRTRHNGIDFPLPVGCPLYATGDGTVEKIVHSRYGYGNYVLINHGFGYKTRYAHMSSVFVKEGDRLKRGDFIGKSGHTGKSTAPHLHYEVIYMGRYVNPYNYMDMTISPDEYSSMIRHVEAEGDFALHPSHQKK